MTAVKQISDISERQKQGSRIILPFLVLQIIKSLKFTKILVTDFSGYSNENNMNSYFIGSHMIMPNEVFPLICFDSSVDRILASYSRSLNRKIDIDEYNLSFGDRETLYKENYLFVMVEAHTKLSSFGFEGKINKINLIDYKFVKLNKRFVNNLFNNIVNVCGIEWAVSDKNDFHNYLKAYKGYIDDANISERPQAKQNLKEADDKITSLSGSNIEEIIHAYSSPDDSTQDTVNFLNSSKSRYIELQSTNQKEINLDLLQEGVDLGYADVDDSLYEELDDDTENTEPGNSENMRSHNKISYKVPSFSVMEAVKLDRSVFLNKPIEIRGTRISLSDGKLSENSLCLDYFNIRNVQDIDFLVYDRASHKEYFQLNKISIVFLEKSLHILFLDDLHFLRFLGYSSKFSELVNNREKVTEQLEKLVSKYNENELQIQVKMCKLPTLSCIPRLVILYDDARTLEDLIQ